MNFQLSEEQKAVQQAARDFAKNELLPGVIERDEYQKFPIEQFKKLGELGFLGMMVDPIYGGSGIDAVAYVLAMKEISNINLSSYWGLEAYGHDARYPRIEADNVGDHYLFNGTKNLIVDASGSIRSTFKGLKADKNVIKPTIQYPTTKQLPNPSRRTQRLTASRSEQNKTIFVCYSHKNMAVHDCLHVHIKPLAEVSSISLWSDQQIKAGDIWREQIEKSLEKAKIAICLVSAEFLASDFIMNNELPKLLKAAEDNGKTIIPLIVSHCDFTNSKLARFQAINDPNKPLNSLKLYQKEKVFVDVVNRVRNI